MTDYRQAFIAVAVDCPAQVATVPEKPGTVARVEFELLAAAPYSLTQSDVLFEVHRRRGGRLSREEFFSRSQACLRASPLGKSYGWGLHFDAEGRIGLVPRESAEYRQLADSPDLEQFKAMRNRRA